MINSLGWQRVFAALPGVTVVAFNIDAVGTLNSDIALTLAVDGWARHVRWGGARLAHAAASAASEAELAAVLLQRLEQIALTR